MLPLNLTQSSLYEILYEIQYSTTEQAASQSCYIKLFRSHGQPKKEGGGGGGGGGRK